LLGFKLPGIARKADLRGPIGLEISLEYAHLVQLHMVEGHARLLACASAPLGASFEDLMANPSRFEKIISGALKQGGFRGNQVVTSMPSTMTRVMSVNYELKNGQNDNEAISRLLLDRIGDDLADFVVDYMPIHQDNRISERAALIAMCRKDSVNSYLAILNQCGLAPIALEIGPVAIKRLVDSLQHNQPTTSSLVVNCGREKSYMTIISKQQILSDDEIDFGERTVVERTCQALDIDPDMALNLLREADLGSDRPDDNTRTLLEIIRPEMNQLVQDVQRGLVYATSENHGMDDTGIYLIGSIARWRGMDKVLGNILNHRVKTIPNPLQPFLSLIEREQALDNGRPELAVAAGLSLRDFHNG
jgi:type IV pilus assembly protein PilM